MVCFRTIRCNGLPVVPKRLEDRSLAIYCQEMGKNEARPNGTV
jgi:hypothetical protein